MCNNCGNSYQWHQSRTRHEKKCLGLDRKEGADCLHETDLDVDKGFKTTETGLGLADVNADSGVEMNETFLDLAQKESGK